MKEIVIQYKEKLNELMTRATDIVNSRLGLVELFINKNYLIKKM